MHSPCHISAKHAFLGTHLHLSMPFREMLLTRHSVSLGYLPTTHRVPGIPGGTTGLSGPFIHAIVQFSRRTHGYHYPSRRHATGCRASGAVWAPVRPAPTSAQSPCHAPCGGVGYRPYPTVSHGPGTPAALPSNRSDHRHHRATTGSHPRGQSVLEGVSQVWIVCEIVLVFGNVSPMASTPVKHPQILQVKPWNSMEVPSCDRHSSGSLRRCSS